MRTTLTTTATALLGFLLTGAGIAARAQQTNAPAQPSSDTTTQAQPTPDTATQQTATTTEIAKPDASSPETPARANSKVRIVRLSEVKGAVQLDRTTGRGMETAMPNLPITEGARLATGTGVAEVEFEDNSTLRLAPDSLVQFSQLELLPSGAKASTVQVLKGTVYASMANSKGNEFTLAFGQEKLRLDPSSHIRLNLQPGEAKLAVFDGSAQVADASGNTQIGKKKTMTFNFANPDATTRTEAKNVTEDQFDAWDKNSTDYHKRLADASAFGSSAGTYGVSDMLYYGSFMNVGGCGSMWRPYLVSAGWDPFANGTWAYYPQAGYSWVSPYPWGWTPFHTGSWAYCEGAGWGWQPGGAWMGLSNTPLLRSGTRAPSRMPVAPGRPPVHGQPTLVPVNTRPLTASTLASPESFVFRNDSAGLGVPRGSLGNLNKISNNVAQRGIVATPVHVPSSANASNGQSASAGAAPPHAGSPNWSASQPSAQQSGRGGPQVNGPSPSRSTASPSSAGAPGGGRPR